jgi:hypothetical protein
MMSISDNDNDNDRVKITFEDADSSSEDTEYAQDNSEVYQTEPIQIIRKRIVDLSPSTTSEDDEEEDENEDEEEPGGQEESSLFKLLEKQAIWMQKMEGNMDEIHTRLSTISRQIQVLSILRSEVESLPTRVGRILNRKREIVKKVKNSYNKKLSGSKVKKSKKNS